MILQLLDGQSWLKCGEARHGIGTNRPGVSNLILCATVSVRVALASVLNALARAVDVLGADRPACVQGAAHACLPCVARAICVKLQT